MIGLSLGGARILNRGKHAEQNDVGGPFTGPVVRHLMYFVWPRANWRQIVQPILDRMELFNGTRVVAVAYDGFLDIHEVETVFQKYGCTVLPVPNIKELREVVGWLPCLQRVLSDDPHHVIFTAHAKGVTHPNDPVIARWTREMTEINLDFWPAVEQALQRGAMCGAFRRTSKFPLVAHTSGTDSEIERWHYSGSFYWMRSKDLFCRDWRRMDWRWYGTETYPGVQFALKQCECLVGDHCGDLYEAATWDQLQPEIDRWKAAQA